MSFLESDVSGSDHICHDLMNDLTAIEDESAESREFIGNAHSVVFNADGVTITNNFEADARESQPTPDAADAESTPSTETPATADGDGQYQTGLKHFREILEDWEAFILDDQDEMDDNLHV